MTTQRWDAELYDTRHAFVTTLGAGVLETLAAKPGERVLDLGCGTGDHVADLRAAGVDAVGVDASPAMIERARQKHPGLPFVVGDARALPYTAEFDAVVSNAVLHWVPDADAVARSVVRALRPGGRFVAELGGHGNIAVLRAAVRDLRRERGLPPAPSPWYFPTLAEYASVLERAGLEVTHAWLFDRPTPLDGDDGLDEWIRMFGRHLCAGVPDEAEFAAAVAARLRPRFHHDGRWWVDYRRLRVVATVPESANVC